MPGLVITTATLDASDALLLHDTLRRSAELERWRATAVELSGNAARADEHRHRAERIDAIRETLTRGTNDA